MNVLDEIIAAWEEQLRREPNGSLIEFWQRFVPTEQHSRVELQCLLFELAALEMEFSWQRNTNSNLDPTKANKYCELFAGLCDEELRAALRMEEYRVRTRFGDRPTVTAFLAEHEDQEQLRRALIKVEKQLQAEFGPRVVQHQTAAELDSRKRDLKLAFDKCAPLRSADYLVQRLVGAGAFGRVYVAWQHSLQRRVALKFLRKHFLRDATAVERFLQEARLAGGLRHPGIISVHGLGRTPGGSYFLAMDLISGGPLRTIEAADRLQLRDLLDAIAQAAEAMAVAHAAGVIHCDLKPANILRDENGRVTLTDFGLARQLSEPALALCGAGTPVCIAPEQVDACWGDIGPATDVFNLAATLFLLLTGHSTHEGTSVAEILASAVSGKSVGKLAQLCPELPREVSELCMQGLIKSPASARPTMAEFARGCESYCGRGSSCTDPRTCSRRSSTSAGCSGNCATGHGCSCRSEPVRPSSADTRTSDSQTDSERRPVRQREQRLRERQQPVLRIHWERSWERSSSRSCGGQLQQS